MSDVWTEIFKKYGTATIVFAIIASLLIWGLAHWAAAPGSEVSVLWGLVKYTKSLDERGTLERSDSAKPSVSKRPITIDVQSGIDAKESEQAIKSLRAKYGLRELSTFESGKKVSEVPTGTFFFTLLTWIEDSRYMNLDVIVRSLTVYRYKTSDSYIELHLTGDQGVRFVGFTNESDGAGISHLSGEASHSILLSAVSWGTMTSLVSIPLNRIQSSQPREIQASLNKSFNVLEIVVR